MPALFATEALVEHIHDVHAENYGVLDVRKIWHTLQREDIDIGREKTTRLMHLAEHGITASTRTVGDSYDNTLAIARQRKLNQSFGRAARLKKR